MNSNLTYSHNHNAVTRIRMSERQKNTRTVYHQDRTECRISIPSRYLPLPLANDRKVWKGRNEFCVRPHRGCYFTRSYGDTCPCISMSALLALERQYNSPVSRIPPTLHPVVRSRQFKMEYYKNAISHNRQGFVRASSCASIFPVSFSPPLLFDQ